nr:deoxyribose-phosphate aldolase [Sedimentibacter sp.]
MNDIAKYIDHTILKADATVEMVAKICDEAKEYGFYSVCVNPYYVKFCKEMLQDTNVKVCCVVGFPLGANTPEVKAFEAKNAIENGADEIDMVVNIGALKSKKFDVVLNDIKEVVGETKGKAYLKVIVETCLLTDEEKVKACKLAVEAGADFVKTSTGFSNSGATVYDIKLMKDAVNGKCKIKASGGIRTRKDFDDVISAGADRVGASSSVNIVKDYKSI